MEKTQENFVLPLIQGAGKEWTSDKIGWTSESSETICNWYGVKCDKSGNIVSINLTGAGLEGTIPSSLSYLSHLKELKLENNKFRGNLPGSIIEMPSLETLNIKNNEVDGTFPFFQSAKTVMLDISYNRFEGSLPHNIEELLPMIKKFDASKNNFSGVIPNSIGALESLEYVNLSSNSFEGTIPQSIGRLKQLQGLLLDHNKLIGTIPPSFKANESKLVRLFLNSNFLTGAIPVALADLKELKSLHLNGNKFTGTLPEEICQRSLNNFFSEDLSAEGEDRDGCTSVVCPTNTTSTEGVYPCFPCGENMYNPYLGNAEKCFSLDEKDILKDFFDESEGPGWTETHGWTETDIPICDYFGVRCNDAGKVTNITLVNQGLSGKIAESLGFLRHLEELNLADNDLSGNLPSSLQFPPLKRLDISGNKLTGHVPPALCLSKGIDGNDSEEEYNCDRVACSAGTHSATGRSVVTKNGFEECVPCYGGQYSIFLGSKTCYKNTNRVIGFAFRSRIDNGTVYYTHEVATYTVLMTIGVLLLLRACLNKIIIVCPEQCCKKDRSRKLGSSGCDDEYIYQYDDDTEKEDDLSVNAVGSKFDALNKNNGDATDDKKSAGHRSIIETFGEISFGVASVDGSKDSKSSLSYTSEGTDDVDASFVVRSDARDNDDSSSFYGQKLHKVDMAVRESIVGGDASGTSLEYKSRSCIGSFFSDDEESGKGIKSRVHSRSLSTGKSTTHRSYLSNKFDDAFGDEINAAVDRHHVPGSVDTEKIGDNDNSPSKNKERWNDRREGASDWLDVPRMA